MVLHKFRWWKNLCQVPVAKIIIIILARVKCLRLPHDLDKVSLYMWGKPGNGWKGGQSFSKCDWARSSLVNGTEENHGCGSRQWPGGRKRLGYNKKRKHLCIYCTWSAQDEYSRSVFAQPPILPLLQLSMPKPSQMPSSHVFGRLILGNTHVLIPFSLNHLTAFPCKQHTLHFQL